MRKHDVRKWLHAILDLLPVIIIPVFMIYSHRHTIDSGFIDVPQNQVVDFNQISKPFNQWSDFVYSSSLFINNDNLLVIENNSNNYVGGGCSSLTYANHIYLIKCDVVSYDGSYLAFTLRDGATKYVDVGYNEFLLTGVSNQNEFGFFNEENINDNSIVIKSCNVFDLTQMFGSGNEPTIQQFNFWYNESSYDYTLSHKELLKGTSTITYDDTDIMSQVVYQLYNSVDKYFNMGNVFNMTGVYDWFNLNIFNGNAPISIYIVWNIVLYEFVMDLLFLLYGLFMWFIDMVEKIMDKPFKSIK